MSDRSNNPPAVGETIPYVGPVYPITFENYERLNEAQRALHIWASTFVADSNDALTDLLFACGVLP